MTEYQISLFDGMKTQNMNGINSKDEALIAKLNSLPINYWDFKNADTKELTHGLHNYPAVMVYPISRNILKIIKSLQPIETLLDPFSGSGTVLVEGVIAGVKKIYGNDLNPLACLLSEVKTMPISNERLQKSYNQLIMAVEFEMEMLAEIRNSVDHYILNELNLDITSKEGWGSDAPKYLMQFLNKNNCNLINIPNFKNIGYWYRPQVIIDLQIIKKCIEELPENDEKKFLWLAFSEVTRITSNRRNGEFKMFRNPPDKINKFIIDVKCTFSDILKSNIEKMSAFENLCNNSMLSPDVTMLSENAMTLDSIPDNSIDFMITSPPYGDSRTTVAYGEFSKLSLQWLNLTGVSSDDISAIDRNLLGGKKYRSGFEYTLDSDILLNSLEKIKDIDIERAGDVYSFYHDLDIAISTIARKMKCGSYQIWVVGNRTVKLENLHTDLILTELGKRYGLVHIHTIDRNISNKVMPALNSPTNEAGKKVTTMTNEHIVILRKL
ncbi:MAG: hypothetical protein FWD71_12240 [Oscillospiraceae bacterium]|nr:hypothetical protein [Oscillospiraceae bacterium]